MFDNREVRYMKFNIYCSTTTKRNWDEMENTSLPRNRSIIDLEWICRSRWNWKYSGITEEYSPNLCSVILISISISNFHFHLKSKHNKFNLMNIPENAWTSWASFRLFLFIVYRSKFASLKSLQIMQNFGADHFLSLFALAKTEQGAGGWGQGAFGLQFYSCCWGSFHGR